MRVCLGYQVEGVDLRGEGVNGLPLPFLLLFHQGLQGTALSLLWQLLVEGICRFLHLPLCPLYNSKMVSTQRHVVKAAA